MACLTKSPHFFVYRTYHVIGYVMEFNGMNVSVWNGIERWSYTKICNYIYHKNKIIHNWLSPLNLRSLSRNSTLTFHRFASLAFLWFSFRILCLVRLSLAGLCFRRAQHLPAPANGCLLHSPMQVTESESFAASSKWTLMALFPATSTLVPSIGYKCHSFFSIFSFCCLYYLAF